MNVSLLITIFIIVSIILLLSVLSDSNSEKFTVNRSSLLSDGTPLLQNSKHNTAYITVMAFHNLEIYVDYGSKLKMTDVDIKGTKIGSVTKENTIFHFNTPFNLNHDSMFFYNQSKSGPCFWVGHIFINGQYFPTNNVNFSIVGFEDRNIIRNKASSLSKYGFSSGYKRIGCYNDKTNKISVFGKHHKNFNSSDNKNEDYMSLEKCREEADLIGSEYFALKANGKCFSSENTPLKKLISNGKSLEEKCRNPISYNNYYKKSKKNMVSIEEAYQYSTGGSNNVMDIHMTYKNPIIRYYGPDEGLWPSLPGVTFLSQNGETCNFVYGAYAIQPRVGSSYKKGKNISHGNHVLDRWVQYKFNSGSSDVIEFCPDVDYLEFNPQGCSNTTSKETCENTTLFQFKYNNQLCINPNKTIYSKNNFNNSKFILLTIQFFESISKYLKEIKSIPKPTLDIININSGIDQINTDLINANKIACQILNNASVYDNSKIRESQESCLTNFEKLLHNFDEQNGKDVADVFVSNILKATKPNNISVKKGNDILHAELFDLLINFTKKSKILIVKIDSFFKI